MRHPFGMVSGSISLKILPNGFKKMFVLMCSIYFHNQKMNDLSLALMRWSQILTPEKRRDEDEQNLSNHDNRSTNAPPFAHLRIQN